MLVQTETDESARCEECAGGEFHIEAPDPQLALASDDEVRRVLEGAWKFLESASVDAYLGPLLRTIAGRLGGVPGDRRVVLIDEPALRTFVLPSGVVLLSTGMLGLLHDEAELAFVLAHELAHAASGKSALRLVRMGLKALVAGHPARADEAWLAAIEDLMKLGYGDDEEFEADRAAVDCLRSLGYDIGAAKRLLGRIEARSISGDAEVSDYALAHPSAPERIRRFEFAVASQGRTASRLNREVFRRAVGHSVLTSELESFHPFTPQPEARPGATKERHKLVWTGGGILLLAALFILIGWLLGD